MQKQTQTGEPKVSRAVFVVARIIVGVVAFFLLGFGCGFCWATISGETAWWGLPLGLFMLGGGLWFSWSAVRPHRQNVTDMSTNIVARILAEFF
jgi:hypothetical protein